MLFTPEEMREVREYIESQQISPDWKLEVSTYRQCSIKRQLDPDNSAYEYIVITYDPSLCTISVLRSIKMSHDLPPSVAVITFGSDGKRVVLETGSDSNIVSQEDEEEDADMMARTEPTRSGAILTSSRAADFLRQLVGWEER